jgi:hypothetical protein
MDQFPMPLPMLIFCFSGSSFHVDDTIIHEDGKPSLLNLMLEYGIHHHLKHGWGVGELKEHDC